MTPKLFSSKQSLPGTEFITMQFRIDTYIFAAAESSQRSWSQTLSQGNKALLLLTTSDTNLLQQAIGHGHKHYQRDIKHYYY